MKSGISNEAARRFLEASAARDKPARDAAFAELLPHIQRQVGRIADGMSHMLPASRTIDDVVQEVCARLTAKPPARAAASSPAVQILAWTKRTAINYLTDCGRRKQVRNEQTDDGSAATAQIAQLSENDRTHRELQRLDAHRQYQELRDFVGQSSSACAAYLDARWRHPDATPAELSRLLDKSTANIYQLRSRLRRLAVRFRELRASEE